MLVAEVFAKEESKNTIQRLALRFSMKSISDVIAKHSKKILQIFLEKSCET
jgi:hypothetical protein